MTPCAHGVIKPRIFQPAATLQGGGGFFYGWCGRQRGKTPTFIVGLAEK
jgi:hypothetical protein